MGRSIISYDSPWEEIVDAARAAPWSREPVQRPSALARPSLTEKEMSDLAGIPILLIKDRQLPAHPLYQLLSDSNPEYHRLLSERAKAVQLLVRDKGEGLKELQDVQSAFAVAGNKNYVSYINFGLRSEPGTPAVRCNDSPDHPLVEPLPHRLEGDLVATAAIILTDPLGFKRPMVIRCATRQLWMPEADFRVMSEAHELLHTLQLRPSRTTKPLLDKEKRERDAENGGLLLYQTAFGGSRTLAAARIITHMSSQFQTAGGYGFRPGLPVDKLDTGKADATALGYFCLYSYLGQTPPRWLALQAVGHRRAKNLPENVARMFGNELDEILLFSQSYRACHGYDGMFRDTLKGLRKLQDRGFDDLPEQFRPLAQQLADAAAFTNPELMGHDPVKPRVSYSFAPATKAASLA